MYIYIYVYMYIYIATRRGLNSGETAEGVPPEELFGWLWVISGDKNTYKYICIYVYIHKYIYRYMYRYKYIYTYLWVISGDKNTPSNLPTHSSFQVASNGLAVTCNTDLPCLLSTTIDKLDSLFNCFFGFWIIFSSIGGAKGFTGRLGDIGANPIYMYIYIYIYENMYIYKYV
jgi:hypothetical protein